MANSRQSISNTELVLNASDGTSRTSFRPTFKPIAWCSHVYRLGRDLALNLGPCGVKLRTQMDVSGLRQTAEFHGEDGDDDRLCHELFDQAKAYVTSFRWCRSVKDSYVGDCVGGIFALVLFRIEPATADVDEWIWVVVGDLPPAYIAPASSNPHEALEDYIWQMSKWVRAVRAGRPVLGLIPVNTDPTRKSADELESRLRFLKKEILPHLGHRAT